MTGLIHFSTDAPSNDVAASPIFWGEGQSAGSVNNSARAMMAALACWHADQTAALGATGGAAGALAINSNQGFKAADLARGFGIAFQVDAANPGPVTLNIDGIGARPVRRHGNIDLAPRDLIPGAPYAVGWLPNLGCYTLRFPAIEQPGRIAAFASEGAIPPGWVPCDGRALSRTAYSALLFFIGLGYGAPDASTFNVPDLRGRTLFGQDAGAGRLTGAGGLNGGLTATGGSETVALASAQMPSHSHGASMAGAGGHDHGGLVYEAGQHAHGGSTTGVGEHSHTGTVDSNGLHGHNGTTNGAGSHAHDQGYQIGTAGSGSTNRVMTDLQPTGAENGIGQSKSAGSHSHSFRTDADGIHAHTFTSNGAGAHAHGINTDGAHRHSISRVDDHSHGLTIDPAGSGAAHPNVPPGAVVIWAIRA